jgi:hypothetical protein
VRNPWRASFDRVTGDLYFGDVGMDDREEIDFEPASSPGGRNYGWPCMEGTHCTGSTQCVCDATSLTRPVHDYGHAAGLAVIGGCVYRGQAIPAYQGLYLFADFLGAKVWSMRVQPDGSFTEFQDRSAELVPAGSSSPIRFISSIGEDADGELYLCSLALNKIYAVVPNRCLPEVDIDPQPLSRQIGATLTLRVYAASNEPMTYHWRRDGMPLTDGDRIAGAETSTLTISNAQAGDSGVYDVTMTTSCGTTASQGAQVNVFVCRSADSNGDGVVAIQDLFDFLTAYFTGDPRGDFNQVGGVTIQDIFDYLASWFAQCV